MIKISFIKKLKQNFFLALPFILAYISVYGFSTIFINPDGKTFLANSIFSVFICFFLIGFFKKILQITDRRLLFFSGALGFIFSSFIVFGTNIFSLDTTAVNELKTWSVIFSILPFFATTIIYIFKFVPKINTFFERSTTLTFGENLDIKKFFFI